MKPSIELYTDGACRKTGEGGWGYVLRVTASGKELEGFGGVTGTTSQRMELTAALEGLQRLECPCKVNPMTTDLSIKCPACHGLGGTAQ